MTLIMGQKLSPKENELYKRVDEVLHYLWDPIGVSGSPYARDEYYSYLPKVFSLLLETKDGKDITDYLMDTANNTMALTISRNKTEEVTNILLEWKDKIFNGL